MIGGWFILWIESSFFFELPEQIPIKYLYYINLIMSRLPSLSVDGGKAISLIHYGMEITI